MKHVAISIAFIVASAVNGFSSARADEPPALNIRSPDGNVLIAADQIRDYEWKTHTLTLQPTAIDELAKHLRVDQIVSGVPFVVVVGEESVYKGIFTTINSSRSFSAPVIVIDAPTAKPKQQGIELRIQLGYPTKAFFRGDDPRADERILRALKAGGKLAETNSKRAE